MNGDRRPVLEPCFPCIPIACDPGRHLARPGNVDIQLDLFLDYANNVKLYPQFQEYFRKHQPSLLAVWGQFDPYFTPPGAHAFQRDIPNAVVQLLPTGHFALETHLEEITQSVRTFLAERSL